jgi:DNA-directed RNA polymerase subunit N (RpoN/RPB10)
MSKKIMYLWGFIVLLICSALIILGNVGDDYTLYKLERNIKLSATKYLKDNNMLPNYNESEVVFVQDLLRDKYIEEDLNIEKYCIKEVLVTNRLIVDKYEILKDCKVELKNKE